MIKKIICLGVVLIMCLGLLAGCGNENTGEIISEEPFYSLQAAYNEGYLNKSDLKKIAKRHVDGYNEILNAEIENSIRQTYLECYPQETKVDTVIIDKYYGTFNKYIAIMIHYPGSLYTLGLWSETIGGVKINYTDGQRIYIWENRII